MCESVSRICYLNSLRRVFCFLYFCNETIFHNTHRRLGTARHRLGRAHSFRMNWIIALHKLRTRLHFLNVQFSGRIESWQKSIWSDFLYQESSRENGWIFFSLFFCFGFGLAFRIGFHRCWRKKKVRKRVHVDCRMRDRANVCCVLKQMPLENTTFTSLWRLNKSNGIRAYVTQTHSHSPSPITPYWANQINPLTILQSSCSRFFSSTSSMLSSWHCRHGTVQIASIYACTRFFRLVFLLAQVWENSVVLRPRRHFHW